MKAVFALAVKELRLLLRDRTAAGLLLGMPLLFILVLGLLLGEGFGEKSDDRLRVSCVDLDEGPCPIIDPARVPGVAASTIGLLASPQGPLIAATTLYPGPGRMTYDSWSRVVLTDLGETAGIKIEIIGSEANAQQLVREHKRSAILVFKPTFSQQLTRCSFLVDGLNPYHRDGVYLDRVHMTVLRDETQPGGSAIIEQVAQVSLLRVILPYMIGQAFGRLSDPEFIDILSHEVRLPFPAGFLGNSMRAIVKYDKGKKAEDDRVQLKELLRLASGNDQKKASDYRGKVGDGVKVSLQQQFVNYNLSGKTWADLTKSQSAEAREADIHEYTDTSGSGALRRGAQVYQVLVPSYTVMFAFFLVLTVSWVFVAERRQGTLKRLRAAPLTKGQVLLGKLIPCYAVSVMQGIFLLVAGKLIFCMRWGPDAELLPHWPLWRQGLTLLPIILATSFAAMGLALLVAALARTEIQVALYGAVPVLVLALIGGCIMPVEMLPEQSRWLTMLTPHGWALSAYKEMLGGSPKYEPNLMILFRSLGVLVAFGGAFLGLAWGLLRLE